jgi:hypothetical protein
MNKQALLAQMADIRGLHKVDWWPLAWGWWAMIAAILAGVAYLIVREMRRRAHDKSWKGDASRALVDLEAQIGEQDARPAASELSALMRRIAMQRFTRAECAGLEGDAWLDWLAQHDPKKFDWRSQGRLLIEAPYAPPDAEVDADTVHRLIGAAKAWVA